MKIALITPVFSIAGVPLAQYRFARALNSRGHSVELIIGHLPTNLSPEEIDGLKINILHKKNVLKMFYSLCKMFYKNKYDVIFSAEDHLNVVVLLAAILTRTKSKISASSRVTPFDTYSSIWFSKKWILKILTRMTMYRADVLSCVSKDMVHQYRTIFKESPHQCIYNIVDDEDSRKKMLEPVDHPWFNQNEFSIIIASGRLAPWKGFDYLIKSVPEILKSKKVKLLILGDGELRQSLNKLIVELNLQESVQLLGFVFNPLKYYYKSDIFVLSSYVEGLPNVLIEAMMCGCTPVSTDCPTGPREILGDKKFGYLVPMRDEYGLAKGVISAIESPINNDLLLEAVKPFHETSVLNAHSSSLGVKL